MLTQIVLVATLSGAAALVAILALVAVIGWAMRINRLTQAHRLAIVWICAHCPHVQEPPEGIDFDQVGDNVVAHPTAWQR